MNVTPIKRQRRETKAQYVVRVWTGLLLDGVPDFVSQAEAREIAQAYGVPARRFTSTLVSRAQVARALANLTRAV